MDASRSICPLSVKGLTPHEKKMEKCIKKLKLLNQEVKKDGSTSNAANMRRLLPRFKRNGMQASKKESVGPGINSTSENQWKADAKTLITPQEIRDVYFSEDDTPEGLEKFRVKLLVTALSVTVPLTSASRIRSKITKAIGITKFGTVHTAVHAGSQIIEWTDAAVVLPEPASAFFNRKTIFAVDLELVDGNKKFDSEAINKMCEVIARWNGTKDYRQVGSNCQDFTTELLDALGVNQAFNKDSKIKKFLDTVDQVEGTEISFEHTFTQGSHTEHMIFRTHAALDIACHQNFGPGADEASEEYRLLKAYDRVFWLRFFGYTASTSLSIEEKVKLIKTAQCCDVGCYFKSPIDTDTAYGKTAYEEAKNAEMAEDLSDGEEGLDNFIDS